MTRNKMLEIIAKKLNELDIESKFMDPGSYHDFEDVYFVHANKMLMTIEEHMLPPIDPAWKQYAKVCKWEE